MRRRALLTTGATVSASLSGCLGRLAADGRGTDTGTERDWNGEHDLVLANYDDEPRVLSVVVELDGETLVDGTYELPDGRGGVFEDIGRWEERYEIDAELGSGESETFVWETTGCADVDEAPDGSRDGGVGIQSPHGDGELSFYRDGCDALYGDVPTGPASLFEVDGSDG
ncbi:hypothetical protein [Haloarchaeobius sp. HRN-SO-5]|uniref:hypothetical protein n=1 Tax=Haloarchaeobius sp. HRN-SO-5 TaxID=3446118 RepID=UPI003EBBE9D7